MKAIVPSGVALGELASRLVADESGALEREYNDMFVAAQTEARRRLHEPLPSQHHEAAVALAEGAEQCAQVIEVVWDALHP